MMTQVTSPGSTLDYLTAYPDGFEAGADYPLVLCLHGYGADMHDLAGLAPALDASGYLYVLPDAPLAAAEASGGEGRAWFERGGNESPEAVRRALTALDCLVREVMQRYRVPSGRLVLLGFSQGGALALRYGLPRPDLVAGIAVLSGSLRRVEDLRPGLPASRNQPIFVAHGTADPLVPVEWGHQVAAFLEAEGYQPVFRTYPIGHQISLALVQDLRAWLATVVPRGGSERG